jgi:ABC-2 type transport system permease protein
MQRQASELWLRTAYARAWIRLKSIYGEPLWVVIGVFFPLFTSFGLAFLYTSTGDAALAGFAILGGVMVSFWSNVIWSMASQFYWDKQEGMFELYLVSPAPLSAILVGMSIGGFAATAPSALFVAVIGWHFFGSGVNPSWLALGVTFVLTLSALYALGMCLASLYLVYGRNIEAINDTARDSVSMFSGVYFPTIGAGSPFPVGLQAAVSLIPLTVGMDALRRAIFYPNEVALTYEELLVLAVMAVLLILLSDKAVTYLSAKGRRDGTLVVKMS